MTTIIAVVAAVAVNNVQLGYLAATAAIAFVTNYFFRFSFDRSPLASAASAVVAGMIFGASVLSIYVALTIDMTSAFLGFWLGGVIGALVAAPPVLLIAMIPGPRFRYFGERINPPNLDTPTLDPYTDTQGF